MFRAGRFDVVLCHGVLMYFPDPGPMLAAVAAVTAPGGLASLLVRNGDALAMRPGLRGDWAAADAAFDGPRYLNRIGVRARADRLDDLTAGLAAHDLDVQAWYGVRVFTDLAGDDAPVPDAGRSGCSWPARSGPGAPTPTGPWPRCCTSWPGGGTRSHCPAARRTPPGGGSQAGR